MAAALGAIGMGATLAGGYTAAEGARSSAAATQQSYNYQAGVAEINSKIDLQNADYARGVGELKALDYGMKAGQQASAIRNQQAASGLDVNSGSNAEVQRSQQIVTNMDNVMIRNNAAKVAYDYTTKSFADLNQAKLDRMAGENAITAGDYQAKASILGAVSSVASKWSQGMQSGMFGGVGGGTGFSLTTTGGLY